MLDRWFLSKLSPRGKMMYWVGQISMLLLLLGLFFGVMDMTWRDGQGLLILSAIGVILVWGFMCTLIWPVSEAQAPDAPGERERAHPRKARKRRDAPTGQP